jgi:hypothetical protein
VDAQLRARNGDERLIDPERFIITGPLTIIVIVALIPVLFRIGEGMKALMQGGRG